MRLFIAVDLDDAARATAAEFAERAKRRLTRIAAASWTRPDNMHLTLRFIGEMDDRQAGRIQEVLEPAMPVKAGTLRLLAPGVFPSTGNPRVLWLGVADAAATLRQVHAIVEERLQQAGLDRETRPFAAHLTVARFRDSRGVGRQIRAALETLTVPDTAWRVERITLYQSKLSPKGSTYTPLLYTPLRTQARA